MLLGFSLQTTQDSQHELSTAQLTKLKGPILGRAEVATVKRIYDADFTARNFLFSFKAVGKTSPCVGLHTVHMSNPQCRGYNMLSEGLHFIQHL